MKTNLNTRVLAALACLVVLPVTARAQLEPDRPDFVQQLSMALVRNAKQLCSVIFVVGRTPKEAMSIGDITRWETLNDWWKWHKIDVFVDTARKRVTLGRYPAPPRTAVYNETLGCTMLPAGEDRVLFHPVVTRPNLPPAATTPWPMGDAPDRKKAMGINVAKINAVLDSAFANNDPEKGERGWVVLHDGVIVGERYGKGYDRNTRNLSFSAGKSVLATVVGVLVGEGKLRVEDKAPIAEWAAPDPRSLITVKNLLNMEGGLACNNYNQTHPLHFTPEDHHSIGYNDGVDAVQASISVPLRFTPGTVNRYLNCDVLAVVKIVRQIVEKDGVMDQLSFPQRGLFDKIGVRSFVVEPDPYGNFLFNGHDYVTTRDWARLGLLYQQRGMFNGKRVLPEGWDRFVSSPAATSNRYGAFFWLATPQLGIPKDAYYMSGAEGNTTLIMPSHGVVIAKNAWSPVKNFFQLARMVADAVIKTSSDCANNGWRDYGFDGEDQCTSYVARRGTTPAGPIVAGNR